jgi:hypothetical protein
MTQHRHDNTPRPQAVQLAAKARRQLHRLPEPLRQKAEEILAAMAENPTKPTLDTGRMRVGVANRYGYHASLDYHNRIYWTVEADGSAYVWQVGGHLPLGLKNWS